MPRKARPARSQGSPTKYKQQSLLSHFSSSPPLPALNSSPILNSGKGKSRSKRVRDSDSDVEVFEESVRTNTRQERYRVKKEEEEESDSSDVGKIKFEKRSSPLQSTTAGQSGSEVKPSPNRPAKRRRVFNSDSKESEDESDHLLKRTSRWLSKRKQLYESGPQSESDVPQKRKNRLVKGRRPSLDEEADDVMDGIDEHKIIDSRLRGQPSHKSRFMQNLERLKKKKRGLPVAAAESEEETSEDDGLIPGARPARKEDEDDTSHSEDDQITEEEIDDFIVEDEGDAQTATLPAIFSMNTHQDLIHHFKIVCQYLVHLAVTSAAARSRIAERLTSDEYFSVPLSITRRKLADIRDSIVSSVWRPAYKKALQTYPEFTLNDLDFAIPHCDACNLGGRLSKFVGRMGGDPYDRTTFQTIDPKSSSDDPEDEGERVAPEFNLGRFCARRTELFHNLCHWEFELFRELSREVEELSHAGRGFVKIAYAGGTAPPEDVSDADQVMDWLDQRGIINAEWLKVKQLMSNATNLEADAKRGKEDD